jgi:DNA-binding response OmpR family regulator
MASADQKRNEEHGGLSVARSEFASSLSRRLDSIQSAISALEEETASVARRDNLIRRLHALGASAKILGFAAAAESLARAEQQLRTGILDTLTDDLVVVKSQIATLPTLVLRGTYSMVPAPPSASPSGHSSPLPAQQGPWCVLVCGDPALEDTLRSAGSASSGFELVHTADTSRVRDLCVSYGPDAIVLDGTLPSLKDLLQTLKDQPETADTPVIVAQPADTSAATLPELGAHTIVTSNLTPIALWRAVNRTRHEHYALPPAREPLGELDLRELFERATRELRRGLLESADVDSQSVVVPLGDGTEVKAALWSAVARIREILVTRSEGRIRFGTGPEGGIVMTSSAGAGMRGRELADSATIDLTARRIVVADDDPAITWVVGGTLRAVGADVREVHDGRSALSLVHQWWPELVISDVLMPGMDGFALCREIKRDVALRDVPVILLSWKEDLLFRLRELGADADGYLKKEANTSALVERAKELLWPRTSLERRLQSEHEVRGRLDGITPRTLLDLACKTERSLRIALRDATGQYDVRIRERCLRAVTRVRASGSSDRGQSALASFLGVSAGRFSIITDDQPSESEFTESTLDAVLRTPILRARAAQRVLSGASLSTVEQLVLNPDAFSEELALLPLSLRPIVDELLRGTTPGQLLASGATSLRALESLLSDAARRGAVRSLSGPSGEDLLTQAILVLSAAPSQPPTFVPSPTPASFSFQLSPTPPPTQMLSGKPAAPSLSSSTPVVDNHVVSQPDSFKIVDAAPVVSKPDGLKFADTEPAANHPGGVEISNAAPVMSKPDGLKIADTENGFDWAAEASWDVDIPPETDAAVRAERSSPFSRPRFSAEWGSEQRTSPGVGTYSSVRKPSTANAPIPTSEGSREDASTKGPTQDPPEPQVPNGTPQVSHAPASTTVTSDRKESQVAVESPQDPGAALEIHTLIAPPPPALSVEYKTQTDGHKSPEDEAIFPLFPSAAPDRRSLPRNTPVPLADALIAPSTTMPSQLAPHLEPPESPKKLVQATDTGSSGSTEQAIAIPAAQEASNDIPPEIDGEDSNLVADAPAAPAKAKTQNQSRWLVGLTLTVSTGVLSFFVALPIMRSCSARTPSLVDQESSEPLPSSAAPYEVVPSIAAPTTRFSDGANAVKEAEELPSGVAIAPDKGLIVVKTGGVHSIFVDDEFVGRGPERIVTLAPGVHKVRASLNGEEHTESVNAVAGRAVEVFLERPGN